MISLCVGRWVGGSCPSLCMGCVAFHVCVCMYACGSMDAADKPTIPSTVGEEKLYNPFMRVHEASVQAFTGLDIAALGGPHAEAAGVAVMGTVRAKKNSFK